MKYKISRFNNYAYKDNGELLIYNSFTGNQSLSKVISEDASDFMTIIQGENIENRLTNEQLQKLLKKGIIVPQEDDELEKIKFIYNKRVNGSILDITILPTRMCNFRCKYCYESFENEMMDEEVCPGIIKL